jgi:hypothetical protein
MNNETSSEAEITWFIKEDSILSSPFFISNSREVKFSIPAANEAKKIKMSFGIGSWSVPVVTNLVDDLDSVKLEWDNKVIVLSTEEDMRSWLMARRRSLDKSKIHINLRENDEEASQDLTRRF